MIDIVKYEDRLKNCILKETGKPFNKWRTDTRTEIAQNTLNIVESLNSEIEQHKNELVIDNYDVVRLVDVIDGDDGDFYYVFNSYTGMLNEPVYYQATCLSSYTILKGFLPDEEYDSLVKSWNLNNKEKAK